jgi:hypothetical protein
MAGSARHRWTKGLGVLVGACLAAVAIHGWQVPRGSGALAAELVIEVNRTGELDVAPVGRFLAASGMRAGARPAQGSFRLHNQTARPLRVRLRARPSIPDLDALLELRVTAGRHELFEGRLRDLRRWTRAPLLLRSGEARRLAVRAWLPRGAHGYDARSARTVLDLRAEEA